MNQQIIKELPTRNVYYISFGVIIVVPINEKPPLCKAPEAYSELFAM